MRVGLTPVAVPPIKSKSFVIFEGNRRTIGSKRVRSIITAQATIRYLVTRLRSLASLAGAQFAALW